MRDDLEPPVDLGPLRLDAARYEALAARIEAFAAPELTRRSLGGDVPQVLARAVWPALIAAAAAAVLAVGLGGTSSEDAESSLALSGIEHVLPGRTTDVSWIEEQRAPTDADLVQAIGLGSSQ